VGVKDFRLYKVNLITNAPAVNSFLKAASDSSIGTLGNENDSKRLSDIRQMASALELYYNDKGGYPEGKDGKPLDMSPTYIVTIPTQPTPAGKACSEYYNIYWYTPKGEKKVVSGKTVYFRL